MDKVINFGGLKIFERSFQNGSINKSSSIDQLTIGRKTPGLAIKYVQNGSEIYRVNNKERQLSGGQFLLIRSDIEFLGHQSKGKTPNHGLCVNINMTDDLEHLFDNDLLFNITYNSIRSTGLGQELSSVGKSPLSLVANGNAMLQTLSQELKSLHNETLEIRQRLLANTKKKKTIQFQAQQVLSVREYIFSNYNQKLSLDHLAQQALLSKYHLLRLFRLAFGLSPNELVHQLRMQKAGQLLDKDRYTFEEIAYQLGYPSHSAFSVQFKKHYNCTPSQFYRDRS